MFSTQPFTTKLVFSNFKNFRYCWYWKKNNVTGGAFSKVQPMRCIEDICVFYKKKPTYNPQGLILLSKPKVNKPNLTSEVYDFDRKNPSIQRYTNYPKHLIEFNREKTIYHPTQKPVALLEYLIKTYTNEGETVLDNCMGSGSTGVACKNTNRRFIGFELDKTYYDIACKRIDDVKKGGDIT